MAKEEHFSPSAITWGRIFTVLLVSIPLALVCVIMLGMKSQQPSACTSIQEQLSKQDSAEEERLKYNYGIRSPGYGRALQGL